MNKRVMILLVFLCQGLFNSFAYAQLPASILKALKSSGVAENHVAIYVQSVAEAKPSLEHNATVGMNPASVMKLVTTNAALDLLGPTYRWKTEIYRDGDVKNGVLKGNLIIKGGGDPSFNAQEFWRLLINLQQAGIKEIQGDFLIDKSLFAQNMDAMAAFDDEPWRAYNAKASAFLVHGRHTSFVFNVLNGQVKVEQEFALPEVQIVNHMQLSKKACGAWRSNLNYTVQAQKNSVIVDFTGSFSADCGKRYLELSVLDDSQYAFNVFKKLWAELGGKFSGNLKVTELPNSAEKVTEQYSEPLAYVIRDLNKWSNNLMARQLLLTIAAEKQALPADEAKGQLAIKDWLVGKNLKFDELVVDNGAGLSRIASISAEHLAQMLISAFNSPVMPELMASLPILGVDGTVEKRLKQSEAEGRAHLKTGSINGVSAIAGYVLDAKNRRQVLVVLVNDAKAAQSKLLQDSVIEWVYSLP